jgi:multidrug/hemolysin transport system permease protein
MSKNLSDLWWLTKRHIAIYFKDRQTFFMSLLTPLVILVLYVTFLRSVYANSLVSSIPSAYSLPTEVVDSFTACWLVSSILGTTSVTLAFCSNVVMISDKIDKTTDDLNMAPVKKTIISLSYFLADIISTAIVCYAFLGLGFGYIAIVGWYLSVSDVLLIALDLLLCIMFGAILASIVEQFINTTGGASAVLTLISSMYGFLCGAYMPISQFAVGIQNFVAFIPGTYGTIIFRKYFLRGVLAEAGKTLPSEYVEAIGKAFDTKIYAFGNEIPEADCFLILGVSIAVLLAVFVAIIAFINRPYKHATALKKS